MKLEFKLKELKTDDKGVRLQFMNVRCAFVYIATPDTRYATEDKGGNVDKASYQLTMLIPKSPEFQKKFGSLMQQAAQLTNVKELSDQDRQKCLEIALSLDEGSVLKDGNNSLSKDNGQIYDGFAEHYSIRAHTQAIKTARGFEPRMPLELVNLKNQPIPRDQHATEFYSGMWADVIVTFKPFKNGTNKGITGYLGAVRKVADDAPFGGSVTFEDTRDDIDIETKEPEAVRAVDGVKTPGFLDE